MAKKIFGKSTLLWALIAVCGLLGPAHVILSQDAAHAALVTAPTDTILTSPQIRYTAESSVPTKRQSYVAKYHSTKIRPAIILIHGGYWYRGDRRHLKEHSRRFLTAGYNVFTPHYRYSMMDMNKVEPIFRNLPEERAYYSAQRDDVAAAVAHIKAHAYLYNTDPNKLILAGFSAGGHLALDYALTGDKPKVLAVGSFSGAVSPLHIQLNPPHDSSFQAQHLKDAAYGLYGCDPTSSMACRRLWNNGEPINKISKNDPPVMLTNGTDEFVDPRDARLFYEAQTKAGARSILNFYRTSGHATNPRLNLDFLSFCSRVLNHRIPANRVVTSSPQ